MALEYAGDAWRSDMQLGYECVSKQGLSLQFLTDDLRRNARLVRRAVRQSPLALAFADPLFCGMRPLVLEALIKGMQMGFLGCLEGFRAEDFVAVV